MTTIGPSQFGAWPPQPGAFRPSGPSAEASGSLLGNSAFVTAKVAGREILASAVDDALTKAANNPASRFNSAASRMQEAAKGVYSRHFASTVEAAVGYDKRLGLDSFNRLEYIGEGKDFKNFRSFYGSRLGWQAIKEDFKDNFKGIREHLRPRNFASAEFMRSTVGKDNTRFFLEPLKDGRVVTTALRGVSAGVTVGFGVYNTRNAYLNARMQEDGTWGSRMQTYATTAGAAAQQGAKTLIAWEMGNIGCVLAKTAAFSASLPALPTKILGFLGLGLFSGGTYFALSKVMPDPPPPQFEQV